jgi:hypothetical protein
MELAKGLDNTMKNSVFWSHNNTKSALETIVFTGAQHAP